MQTKKPWRAVSLFCGCGGADLGLLGGFAYLGRRYKKNPVEIVHASDWDRFCVETYNANFGCIAETADVRTLDFRRGSADIVIGGFPCQPFSTLNPTKKPSLKKNQLFWEMARVVSQVRPKAFVAENVKGFRTLHGGKYLGMAKAGFESLGYKVHDSLLRAVDYGIPQRRERVFLVGIRGDVKGEFAFPEASHAGDPVPLSAVIDRLEAEDPRFYFSRRAVEGVKRAKPNMKRALWQDLGGPCLTITSHLAKVSIYSRDPILLVDPARELYRRFTPREAARIQSFPDSFLFPVSETQAYRQIGNAIPPVMMWHVVRSVLGVLGSRLTRARGREAPGRGRHGGGRAARPGRSRRT